LKLPRILRRFSVYGDIWLRYMHWGTRTCPWYLEPVFMAACSVAFWIFLRNQRNAVAQNLATILPGSSPWMNQIRALRVFWNFAWTMTDLSHVRHGADILNWEIMGYPNLLDLETKDRGAILMTAHMGNYDVASRVFAHHFKNPIHIVRAPERQAESQEFQQDSIHKDERSAFIVHYNEPGNMLGLELARALGEGGVVAIQGDRVLFDVSPLKIDYREGVTWQIPRGPFTLALVGKTTMHPVFIIRMGYRRYRVMAHQPIELNVIGRDKEGAQMEAARKWNEVLRGVIQEHWRQWFVFEPVFQEGSATANVAASAS